MMMKYNRHIHNTMVLKSRRKTFLLSALLLVGGIAHAQVVIDGNVYGGGNKGVILNDTVHQGSNVVVSRIDSTTVIINGGRIKGSVYGGGLGDTLVEKAGLVEGNTRVEMRGGTVVRSIYGGGQLGSVGTFNYNTVTYPANDPNGNAGKTVAVPISLKEEGTGRARVLVSGGRVGVINQALMPTTNNPGDDELGWVFCGSQGLTDSISWPHAIGHGVVNDTYLHISGGLITASAYGGCENGLLLDSTYVLVSGGQIGVGHYMVGNVHHWDSVYTEEKWTEAVNAVKEGTPASINNIAAQFHECDAWPYGIMEDGEMKYYVYDIFADPLEYPEYNSQGGSIEGSNGHSFFGNVFGGGSGYYPIRPGIWRRTAGRVNGNTRVEIIGGHILTSVYGSNEITDVMGNSTVTMSGGTLGVPRTLESIAAHPVTCYLFGAGMGDTRTLFNQWTNVDSTYVNISGGTIFGSIFGGGEEGHVLRNVCVIVKDSINDNNVVSSPFIGTWGQSTFDGNVFGAGRGFSGLALTAGGVGGNTEVNIEGGTMLGSVYGGGRLASVGAYFVAPNDQNYGNLVEDDENGTYGYTIVNIKGGTIGNRFEIESDSHGNYIGGNVFGGSKGRMTLMDGTSTNPIWENLGKVKQTTVNINEAAGKTIVIKGHVFGGGEIGRVEKNTLVNIDNGNIGYDYNDNGIHIRQGGDVYGGGMGRETEEKAGLVKGNAYVDMSNGFVQRSLYGGGKFGSVGTFTEYYTQANGVHIVGEPKVCEEGTGLAKVVISGGQVGFTETLMPAPGTSTYDDDFGYVFCGSRGEADSINYPRANFLAVVDTTYLEISGNALITASAYGGSENGMVLRNTHVKIAGGQIGTGHYKENNINHWDDPYDEQDWNDAIAAIRSGVPATINSNAANFHPCASWPYGNDDGEYLVYDIFAEDPDFPSGPELEGSSLNASDGNSFFGKVYGGGSGYYPIAPGVWRRSAGRVNGNTLVEITGGHILTAVYGANELTDVLGNSTIKMSNGTIGIPRTYNDIISIPTTSHLFGSGLGDKRAYFNQWTNSDSTNVYITGGIVFGSVFGGGEDGHVLRNVCVTVKDSINESNVISSPLIGTWGNTSLEGNVYGGGRGFSGSALTAGSVGGNTEVNIEGGTMLGSVYGGGSLASVGSYFVALNDPNYGQLQENTGTVTHGYTTVNITGGIIGNVHETEPIGQHLTGGNVYGGSKGGLTMMDQQTMNPRWPSLAKVKQTEVNISGDVVIKGDVFGGGEIGTVRDSAKVFVSGGTLMRDLFGGGFGSTSTETVEQCDSTNMTPVMIAGRVYGRTDATISGGLVMHNMYGGGEFAKVGNSANQGQSTVSLNGGVVGSHVGEGANQTLFGGMVYGGGMGILADTAVAKIHGCTYIYDTLSNNTQSPAHVLGHIYGGSDMAQVQKNTYLTLGSVEVGTLANATGTVTKTLPNNTTVNLYQIRALEGGRVFGGGQGTDNVNYRLAALVMGNTYTEITGSAKVNGSVYGGGELANVGSGTTLDNDKNTGSATVVISGGIIGPLNGSQRNGNVFGGGKGHEVLSAINDVYYATVDSTHVVIKNGADIRGSVFGGGANGRVLGNASTDIQGGTIGTTGLTTWDGNVFGGGRNIDAYNNTTGVVRGNTDIQMSGGTIMANMYGGGRFGSVGMDYNTAHTTIDTIAGSDHGYVNINITGGVVGDAYVQYLGHYANGSEMPRTGYVFGGGRGIMEEDKVDKLGNVKGTTVTVGGDALVKSSVYGGSERGVVYKNTLVRMTGDAEVGEASELMALHRGDVYGGGCGYDSIAQGNTYVFLPEAGSVKGNTRVEMDGSKVYGNIYGAGRLTDVVGHSTVKISGGEVGWERTAQQILAKPDFGYVYAAGRGEPQERFKTWTTVDSTYAEVSGGQIWSSLNGGGEEGHVIRNTHVVVKGGIIGTTGTTGNDGNVFGAGRGKNPLITGVGSAAVSGNTQVDIQDGRILGSVFGGGNSGSVGVYFIDDIVNNIHAGDTIQGTDHGYTLVNVSGGTIGHEDNTGRTGGNVYGGCRGVVVAPSEDENSVFNNMSHVKQTEVNIFEAGGKQTFIMGSVFGGGEDGHVFKDTYVNVSDGQIGGLAYSSSPALCSDRYHGNVYGGGRGLDTYTDATGIHYSTTAGVVYGNTNVFIEGGYITRNVYGGGNMSSVGIASEQPVNGVYKTGLAKVTIAGGTVGVSPDLTNVNGMVFGSAHGKAGEAYKDLAMVKNTEVLITGDAQIKGSVFGSGEDGHTRLRSNVIVGDGGGYTCNGLVIGTTGASGIDGNVYGGGRGLDTDESGNISSTAGIVGISTSTLINNGTVLGSVFGGGNMASIGYELVLDTLSDGTIIWENIPDDYGKATVTVTGNATVGSSTSELENGNVFGSGKGRMGTDFASLSYVNETEVLVNGNAKVYGSVFGGGEDGHVRACLVSDYPEDTIKPGNTHVTIAENAVIGDESVQSSAMKGNVYGGGRGLDKDHLGNNSPTAGVVEGNTKVDILNGTIWRSVFGGGNESVVKGQRVTNVLNGTIHADVHGGSNAIPSDNALWAHGGLKTVNVRGGYVMGNVYGCSHSSNDGEVEQSQANAKKWTSFVNINGGTIDGSVHGAGYAGLVNGSVCVNIGKDAILNAPNKVYNVNYNKPHTGSWDQTGINPVEPTVSTLVIGGSVYGGSNFYGTQTTNDWDDYDLTGYSLIFIDGKDYNTTDNTGNYMTIGGGLFGSGTHTESGQLGRHILLKDYGTRNETSGEMTAATRTLTTIQRANNVIIDHANINLSGLQDISNAANENNYGVMRVNDTLAVINASGIVLGSSTPGAYAHMDSIYTVQSLNLANSNASIYDHNPYELKKNAWYWLGIKDGNSSAQLYNISGTGGNAQVVGDPLTFAQENVILYNDTSKLWVRYHAKHEGDATSKQYYGELLGFFRMRGDEYHPVLKDTVSFAYARPKIINDLEFDNENLSDGGFMSYNIDFNYFTDDGNVFTKTNQYPYINVLDYTRGDREDYRLWVDVKRDRRWYVDGTRGWGRDDMKKYGDDSGVYPDKPKKTLFGKDANNNGTGIVNEVYTSSSLAYLNYSHKDDVIYVVGAISAEDEKEMLRDAVSDDGQTRYPLKLYRYPGGHTMSNGRLDYGGAKVANWGHPNGEEGDAYAQNRGPGANYGAMLNVQASESVEMRGVLMDGLYGYTPADTLLHEIYNYRLPEESKFKPSLDTLPLVLTHPYSTLSMHGGTVLKRGYNNRNAEEWYTDADYKPEVVVNEPFHYHGGAIFVDSLATVNVGGLDSIVGNKQYLKIGNEEAEIIDCNVYLPTFFTHLYISDSLTEETRIGVTSPKRNTDEDYKKNTLSPVAKVTDENKPTFAEAAWLHCNFQDDLEWFFVNGHSDTTRRTTYYDPLDYNGDDDQHLKVYLGWTWANVVRKEPSGFAYNNIDSREDLAWLISKSAGMNKQTAIDFSNIDIEQTNDIDLKQYVWVPLGEQGTSYEPFAGSFDGRGHLISNLNINYIGMGDFIYERTNYGMFGYVNNDTINRTFVVSGEVIPMGKLSNSDIYNIGGLVGYLNGNNAVVSNSEAAFQIYCPTLEGQKAVAGGLVAKMESGEIHSSMAMPYIKTGASSTVGGLVGVSKTGKINNSFVNATFDVDSRTDTIGGLLGTNKNTVMENCYVALHDCEGLTSDKFGSIAYYAAGSIDSCYVMQNTDYNLVIEGALGGYCGDYAPVVSADELGYMYADNRIHVGSTTDTTLFVRLNKWVDYNNRSGYKYARWARPGLSEINGDLPVLMLYDYDATVNHQGDFRSMGTYAGGPVLQYGGPVRDGDLDEVDVALTRSKAVAANEDYLFIYGDVNSVGTDLEITQAKVSIYEHAAILSAGSLSSYDNTYVGITFDNSRRHALSSHGVNGLGMQDLPRDWHMMSSPLSDAPLGFNYKDQNGVDHNKAVPGHDNFNSISNDPIGFFNNPWESNLEFNWLANYPANDECAAGVSKRYWMKTFDPETQGTDGYFPTRRGNLFDDNLTELFIVGSDECPSATGNIISNRFPYGMDLFTWYEPQYHWINFKRNGPNHWHSDENAQGKHEHLDYHGSADNVNEETLITARGYMTAISVPTFMQSHGMMNNGNQSILLTQQGAHCTGWNLVGNPFHGYLDFDAFANDSRNSSLLATESNHPFYVVYNADGFAGAPESAFIYYVQGGSNNGAYAGRYLHPHQGFFVVAADEGSINFTDGILANEGNMVVPRSVATSSSFRDWKPNYPLVNLFLSSDKGCADITVVEFERPEWGGATKLHELRNGNGLFYGYHDGKRYAALFAEKGTTRIPLWFEAEEDDIYTMKWNTANGDFTSLYLIDNIRGLEYDMLANNTYTFEGHKDDYYSRFYIVFNVTEVEEHNEQTFVFFDGTQWVVTGEGELDFIDMQGRILWHDKLSGGQNRVSFPIVAKGVYILRLVNSDETKIQKIIIK